VKLRTILDPAVALAPTVLAIYVILLWNSLVDRTILYRDYWTIFWTAASEYGADFWLGKISILGRGSFGSAFFLQYVVYAFLLIPVIFIIQILYKKFRKRNLRYLYIWVNSRWIAYAIVWVAIATGLAAFAHYLNLYSMPVPNIPGAEVKGEVDWLTHWWTPGIFSVVLLSIDFYEAFGWQGKRGRIYEAIFVTGLLLSIMFYWEWGECGNPAVYRNLYWDSLKDVYQGVLAHIFNLMAYNLLVPFEVVEH